MSNVATLDKGGAVSDMGFSPNQLQIIRKTVAPDLTATEFDLFIEQCRIYGLNPITKQIYAVVYNKNNQKYRRVTLIPSISGLRSMASRTGRYRADNEAARYESDSSLKSGTNPAGLISARVRVYTQDNQGEWYPVEEEAYWEEYCPTGEPYVKGQWPKMPRVMLAKCAEAKALRKAFPEMEGLYVQEEMDQSVQDMPASELVEAKAVLDRRALLGDRTVMILWEPMDPQEAVPIADFFGRAMDYFKALDNDQHDKAEWFLSTNKESLKQFWAEKKDEALELKRYTEQRLAEMKTA